MRLFDRFRNNTWSKFVSSSSFTRILYLGSWILFSCFLAPSVFAKPERLEIKSVEERGREDKAKAIAEKIDFSKIEDPDARQAFRAVFDALHLDHKKADQADSTDASEN